MKFEIWAAVMLCCAAMTLAPSKSQASACDVFAGDAGDNTILVGDSAASFQYQGKTYYYSRGHMAICWADQNHIWQYFENPTGCDIYSTSAEYVSINAGAGDDNVAANSVGHTCVAGYSTYLLPFSTPGFDFYLRANMGAGSDHAYGTENADYLYSNQYDYSTFSYPADSANDFLCGYDGDDYLIGDKDASDSGYWPIDGSGHEERLNGGLGSDHCYGEDGESTFDWAMIPDPSANPRVDPVAAGGCDYYLDMAVANGPDGSAFEHYAHQMKLEICATNPPDLWW